MRAGGRAQTGQSGEAEMQGSGIYFEVRLANLLMIWV